ncbi:hypothetical protein N7462_000692 [Penicillium macrosclerotiorum]|uniref:uncharacterized protein n=1 Tax=Penicillium macrosclerotiorum TaxID=303699 RepID=UPI002547934C|nr:uncharacterized protein N7462_000692 [Penicillium macrosclerotiorum]KAJ5698687.1 hypothetical protein N7462_000692 [Penicillium macrosclerotiorum]
MSYERGYGNSNPEYGGGGSSGANYYDQNADFSDRPNESQYRDTRYSGPGEYSGGDDFSSAAHHAQEHHSSEDRGLFESALSFLNERKSEYADPSRYDVDEQHAVNAHQAMYGGGSDEGRSHDSGTVGAGAAMQALKMFTSGGSSDGGMDKNKLIGMAMAQAGKLWDEKQGSGANISGDKQSAVNSAAEMALKMYMKSNGGGSSGTGGPAGLMSLASKFLS